MSQAVEETNRRMLPARDAMDRAYHLRIVQLATAPHQATARKS